MHLLAVILLSSLMGQITWTAKTPIPQSLAGSGCAVNNDTIYVIGGRDTNGNRYNTNYIYDPSTDTWTTGASMPTARAHISCAVVGGKIYAIGGWAGSTASNAVEEYDPVGDTWQTMTPMPTPRYGYGLAVVANNIYAIGGMDMQSHIFNTTEAYDPSADTAGGTPWQSKAGMPTARMGPGCAVVNDSIYVYGGCISIGTQVTTVNQCYDPYTDNWTSKANMITGRYAMGSFSYSGEPYAVGGYTLSNYLATIEVYNPASNNWSFETSMQYSRQSVAVGIVANKVYVIGGWNNGALNYTEEGEFPVSAADNDTRQGSKDLRLTVSPNPFTSKVEIRYRIPETGKIENRNFPISQFPISLCIYDMSGRLVSNLVTGERCSGALIWDGKDNSGKKLPGGTYLLKISSKEFNKTSKLVLVR